MVYENLRYDEVWRLREVDFLEMGAGWPYVVCMMMFTRTSPLSGKKEVDVKQWTMGLN